MARLEWTDQRQADLLRLWNEGHSASIIADHLGDGFTRSAVIGKLHRLGAAKRKTDASETSVKPTTLRQDFPWHKPECDAKFRELVTDGYGTREIMEGMAKAFPQEPLLTRNAIQMRAFRLGMSIGGGRKRRAGSPPLSALKSVPPVTAQDGGRECPDVLPPVEQIEEPVNEAAFVCDEARRGVTIMDLRHDSCRWPLGEPFDLETFRYCGASAKANSPYCSSHHALAYLPAKKRKPQHSDEANEKRRRAMLRLTQPPVFGSRFYLV